MKPEWTGTLLGNMHNNGVTYDEVAAVLGVTKAYVSMILNGARAPQGAQERLENAYTEVLVRREAETDG